MDENPAPIHHEASEPHESVLDHPSFFSRFSSKFKNTLPLAVLVLGIGAVGLTAYQVQQTQQYSSKAASGQMYTIYYDSLASGWLEWSNANVDPAERTPVYTGNRSVSYSASSSSSKLYFHTKQVVSTAPYAILHFAARATKSGQEYKVALEGGNDSPLGFMSLADFGGQPAVDKWTVYNIPLTALNAANTDIKGFILKSATNTGQPRLYIDEVQLVADLSISPTLPPKLTPQPTNSVITPTPTIKPTLIPTPTTVPNPTPTSTPVGSGGWWKPTADRPIQLHWQLSTDFDPNKDFVPGATVYDFDGEHASSADVDAVHKKGFIAVCYIDVGVWENYRTDASRFPGIPDGGKRVDDKNQLIPYTGDPQYANVDIIGKADAGWNGSYWLDIRRLDILAPIMRDRIQMCKDKGFDAVEPDEENGYDNPSGFPLTYNDQLVYNKWLADTVHSMNMSIGLKSAQAMAKDLVNWYDWDLTEECYQYNECSMLAPFKAANKASWIVEYKSSAATSLSTWQSSASCVNANTNHYNAIFRDLNLVGQTDSGYKRLPCKADFSTSW